MIRRIDFRGRPPTGNPLLNALALAGGAVVFAALVLFSLVAFVVVASVIALLAAAFGLRMWWHTRRPLRDRPAPEEPPAGAGRVIEGEYRHVPPPVDREHGDDR